MMIDNKFDACIGQSRQQRPIIRRRQYDAKMQCRCNMTLNFVSDTIGIGSIQLWGTHLMGDQLLAKKVKADPAC